MCAATPPKYTHPEIERRWLVPNPGALLSAATRRRQIEDTYLEGGRLRLRHVLEDGKPSLYKLGKKYARGAGQPDDVVTVYLTEGEYQALRVLPGRTAQKVRHTVQGGALDVYTQPRAGLAVYEREFQDTQAAAAYAPPGFVAEEITGRAEYFGFALAQDLLPSRGSSDPATGSVRVVPCASADQPGWLELRQALWPEGSAQEHLEEMAAFVAAPARYAQFIAVSPTQQPLGFAEAAVRHDYVNGTTSSPVAFLEGIYVAPDARRQGVAARLVEAVAAWAPTAGCHELASDAALHNHVSRAVHRALGFDETEEVVYFRKLLAGPPTQAVASPLP